MCYHFMFTLRLASTHDNDEDYDDNADKDNEYDHDDDWLRQTAHVVPAHKSTTQGCNQNRLVPLWKIYEVDGH
jgi:hypothetical protein